MQLTLSGDSFGRVVGTVACNGAQATVSGADGVSAIADLQSAVKDAINDGLGECFWHEALGDSRWLFRRDGNIVRVVILRSTGTLTGWEHCFWAECGIDTFRRTMRTAIEEYGVLEFHG